MKHAFIYKDENSNKFWWIDYSGNDFVVNYGKFGATGKYEIKEFGSSDECEKQALKLIGQKLKKGYIECLDYDFIQHNYFDSEEIGLNPKTSHPNFIQHFKDDFYYDCSDEETPFGNDNGADTLYELVNHIKKNGNTNVTIFPKMLIEKSWDMTYLPADEGIVEELLRVEQGDKIDELENESDLYMNDQVIIATAFGQIKITGTIQNRLRNLAIQSLKRMDILMRHKCYESSEISKQMLDDLISFPNKVAPKPSEDCTTLMKYLDCPCEIFAKFLDDDDLVFAYECALSEGKEEGYTPLIIVVDDTLLENITLEVDDDSDMDFEIEKVREYRKNMLEKAETIDAKEFLKEHYKEISEKDSIGNRKVSGGTKIDSYSSYWNFQNGVGKEVILAKIPTDKPWEVAVWVPMGNFNDCPNSAVQAAVMKYWYKKYKAVPSIVSYDTWEFTLEKPIENNEDGLNLALEHFGFCYDRITQDDNDTTIGKLASTLMKSNIWRFWWD